MYFMGMYHVIIHHVTLLGEVHIAKLDSDPAFEERTQDHRFICGHHTWFKVWLEIPMLAPDPSVWLLCAGSFEGWAENLQQLLV